MIGEQCCEHEWLHFRRLNFYDVGREVGVCMRFLIFLPALPLRSSIDLGSLRFRFISALARGTVIGD